MSYITKSNKQSSKTDKNKLIDTNSRMGVAREDGEAGQGTKEGKGGPRHGDARRLDFRREHSLESADAEF